MGGANDTVDAGTIGNTTTAQITFSGLSMIFADGPNTYADTVSGFSRSLGDRLDLSHAGHTVASSNQVNAGQDTLLVLSNGSSLLLKGVPDIDGSFFI